MNWKGGEVVIAYFEEIVGICLEGPKKNDVKHRVGGLRVNI